MAARRTQEQFSALFDAHYGRLYNYANKILGDKSIAEELVQETFIKLWENVKGVNNNPRSIESYLIVTLKNKVIDFYRKEQVRKRHIDLYQLNRDAQEFIGNEWEVMTQIDLIYQTLPQKTVEIFKLSRNRGLSYKEIAEHKDISVKTVELHVSKALTAFKEGLKNFLKKK